MAPLPPAAPAGGVLRGAARALRHLPDRLLHPLRRTKATRVARELPPSPLILVLCHGNICRSAYAEVALRRRLSAAGAEEARVVSAGFLGSGRGSPPAAREVAAERGLDLSGHRSRLVSREQLQVADLVLVMNPWQARAARGGGVPASRILLLGDLDPASIETRAIQDPIERPPEVFRDVFARIDRCVERLVSAWEHGRGEEAGAGTSIAPRNRRHA